MSMSIHMYICLCTMYVPDALKSQKRDVGYPGSRLTNGYGPSYGFWELNPGSLQEQNCLFLGLSMVYVDVV